MAEDQDKQTGKSSFLDTSHPPVSGRFRKSATRPKKPAKTPRGALADLFPRPKDQEARPAEQTDTAGVPQDNQSSTTPGSADKQPAHSAASSSYSIPQHGEQTVLGAPLEPAIMETQELAGAADTSGTGTGPPFDFGKAETAKVDEPSDGTPLQGYSNEARAYHARYDELSQAHDEGRFDYCRNGCLDLLTEPRVPYITCVQILQMLSTVLKPDGAEECLNQADAVLNLLNPADFRTRLLRDDNNKMKADLRTWRAKKGLLGKDVAGEDDEDDLEPVKSYFELDRKLEQKLAHETEEEMEPFGRSMILPTRQKPEANQAEEPTTTPAPGPPSPESSSADE